MHNLKLCTQKQSLCVLIRALPSYTGDSWWCHRCTTPVSRIFCLGFSTEGGGGDLLAIFIYVWDQTAFNDHNNNMMTLTMYLPRLMGRSRVCRCSSPWRFVCLQEQHAGPSEAASQAEEEAGSAGVRLPVQLVLGAGPDGAPWPAAAHVGLRQTPGLMHVLALENRSGLFSACPGPGRGGSRVFQVFSSPGSSHVPRPDGRRRLRSSLSSFPQLMPLSGLSILGSCR